MKFDRIVIAVPDLGDARTQYRALLGAMPLVPAGVEVGPRAWLDLGNAVIELVQVGCVEAAISGVVFSEPAAPVSGLALANARQLDLSLCDGSATAAFREQRPAAFAAGLQVDHLVLRSGDADACIALFAGQLGLRLALDQNVPEWGGRMLFFRAGKLTLEVIVPGEDSGGRDRFWGIAYQCPDIELAARRLAAAGVEVTPPRRGRKPGTRVATIKSHCLGIPTLLLEPAG